MNKILKYVLIAVGVLAILGIVASIFSFKTKNKKQNETTNVPNGAVQQTLMFKNVCFDDDAKIKVFTGEPNSDIKKVFMNCKDFSVLLAGDQVFNNETKFRFDEYPKVENDMTKADNQRKKVFENEYLYGNYLSQYNQRNIKLIMYDQWSAKDIKYEDNKCENVIYGTYLLSRWYRSALYNADKERIGDVFMTELEAYDSLLYGLSNYANK